MVEKDELEVGAGMNPEVKKLWTDALSSGEFKQGAGALNRNDREYCCLGVLCELAVRAGVSVHKSNYESVAAYDGLVGCLPGSVIRWAELDSNDPAVPRPDGRLWNLSTFNDYGEYDFHAIAGLIDIFL